MALVITAPRSELGAILDSAAAELPEPLPGRVVINVALQAPNSLLHDGQAWQRYPPERLLADTRSALRRAARADFLVHASYVLAGAHDSHVKVGPRLRPYVAAALEAEHLVLNGKTPACVVRLGYLYGPESRSLKAYRRAFRLGRPYWAGPPDARQRFLHTHDAAAALLAAARQRPDGRLLAACDNQPVSFGTFMDQFARLNGNPLPLHIPGLMKPLSRVIIAVEHMEMVDLPSAQIEIGPRPRGFTPAFAGYRSGLRNVMDAWAA